MDLPFRWTLSGVSLAIFVLGVAGLIAFGATQASATHLSCGDEITADTTLDSDLIDCPNNGIVIGADDITLDLNGHRIDGDGTEVRGLREERGSATSGWQTTATTGSRSRAARRGSLKSACWSRALATTGWWTSPRRRTSSSVPWSAGSSRSVVRDGSYSHNIPPEGDGIGLFGSDHIKIVDNSIKDNPGPGIHVDGSNGNLIKGNLFSHSSPGVLIGGDRGSDRADRNEVRGNRFVRNSGGIVVFQGSRNVRRSQPPLPRRVGHRNRKGTP